MSTKPSEGKKIAIEALALSKTLHSLSIQAEGIYADYVVYPYFGTKEGIRELQKRLKRIRKEAAK